MPWNPETGDGCPGTKEGWEERLEMARKRRDHLRTRGDGGHTPRIIDVESGSYRSVM